ncbi:hypothetical protein JZ751_024160 [Albula glossodonta]|uniref:Uncharacterized protein n=1 Tax=Albula glossodonta TaxID=121402 RepID=A0A8T2NFW5_9TELE|nr:hypothetical protein JZ751_024160 [Albula glossodonta]
MMVITIKVKTSSGHHHQDFMSHRYLALVPAGKRFTALMRSWSSSSFQPLLPPPDPLLACSELREAWRACTSASLSFCSYELPPAQPVGPANDITDPGFTNHSSTSRDNLSLSRNTQKSLTRSFSSCSLLFASALAFFSDSFLAFSSSLNFFILGSQLYASLGSSVLSMPYSSSCSSSSSDSSDSSSSSSSSWKDADTFLSLRLRKASNHRPTGSTWNCTEAGERE